MHDLAKTIIDSYRTKVLSLERAAAIVSTTVISFDRIFWASGKRQKLSEDIRSILMTSENADTYEAALKSLSQLLAQPSKDIFNGATQTEGVGTHLGNQASL